MVKLNGYDVVDRHDRPSTLQAVLLRAYFVNNGDFQDPFDISGVTIFERSANYDPSCILNLDNLIAVDSSASIKAHFGVSSHVGKDNVAALDASDYNPGAGASGVYKLGTGQFGVVLNAGVEVSSLYDFYDPAIVIVASDLPENEYLDVWTVKLAAGSDYKTVINGFHLLADSFYTLTQPLLVNTKVSISPRRITYGSKVNLKAFFEVNIENDDIDEQTLNVIKNTLVHRVGYSITKINSSKSSNSHFEVSSFADTSSLVSMTENNTASFSWDTTQLPGVAISNPEGFASLKGTYEIRVLYTILDEVFKSPPMFVDLA